MSLDRSHLVTDRLLNLPRVVASKYAREGTALYDDFVSRGMVGLALAVNEYDPEHPSGASLETFAWWRVRSLTKPLAQDAASPALSLADLERDDPGALPALARPPSAATDARDALEKILADLDATDRLILTLHHGEGLTLAEVGAALPRPISAARVGVRLLRAQVKARQAARKLGLL